MKQFSPLGTRLLTVDQKHTKQNMSRASLNLLETGADKVSAEVCDYEWNMSPSFPFKIPTTMEAYWLSPIPTPTPKNIKAVLSAGKG